MKITKVLLLIITFIFFFVGSVYALPISYGIKGNVSLNGEKISALSGNIIFDDNIIVGGYGDVLSRSYKMLEYTILSEYHGEEFSITGSGGAMQLISHNYGTSHEHICSACSQWFGNLGKISFDGSEAPGSQYKFGNEFHWISEAPSILAMQLVGHDPAQGAGNFRFEISAYPVPEPCSTFLLSTGLVGFTCFRKKFKK